MDNLEQELWANADAHYPNLEPERKAEMVALALMELRFHILVTPLENTDEQ